MKIYKIENFIRHIRNLITMNYYCLMGRTFVQDPRTTINIEVTSICNLKCLFCAYRKKESARKSMPNDLFFNYIEQAVDLGFQQFGLTPITGDVFMDKDLFEKLTFLDEHKSVKCYSFFTNFTIPNKRKIDQLIELKKLNHITISVYGHDLNSFLTITQSNKSTYYRLLNNLEYLISRLDKINFSLDIGLRSYHKIPKKSKSKLKEILKLYRERGIKVSTSQTYNNWGGYITKEDIKGLDIDIGEKDSVYKKGACSMPFNSIMIKSNGIVNACPCRDVNATLKIGDLKNEKLKDILSSQNTKYMSLIDNQQRGIFPPVCKNCDFYKSIYRRRSFSYESTTLTLEEFKKTIH